MQRPQGQKGHRQMGRMEKAPIGIKLLQVSAECYRIAHACGCEYTGPAGAKQGKYEHIADTIAKYMKEQNNGG